MKKITTNLVLILTLVFGINGAFGQFNLPGGGAFPTGGWIATNNIVSEPIDKGTYYLLQPGDPGDEIISNTNDLSAFDNAEMDFTYWSDDNGTANRLKVEVSYDGGATYTDSFLTQPTTTSDGTSNRALTSISNQVVVRYNIVGISGSGIRMKDIKLTGYGVAAPNITVTPTTLTDFFYIEGTTPTQEQSFDIEGVSLTNDIIITPPGDFEISLTSGAGFVTTPITLSHVGGTVASQSIFVRQIAGLLTANSPFSGNIACASTGATTIDVAVDGKVGLYYPCSNATGVTLAIQDFDSTSPVWNYTHNIPFFDNGTDGFYGIEQTGPPFTNTNFNTNILSETDLNDEGDNGTAGFANIVFDPIDISTVTNVILSFDYQIIGYNVNNDDARYEIFHDGVGQGVVYIIDGNGSDENASGTININIPNSVTSVYLKISIRNDGATGHSGFDNIKLTGDTFASTTWNGTTWSNLAPNQTTKAVFNGNYNTATDGGDINTCECEVKNGATLTIAPTTFLNIESDIVVGSAAGEGTIVVENTGSIVQSNKDAVITGTNFQIQKTTPTYIEYDYTYWSSPIENANLATVFAASQQNRIYEFNTANFNDADGDTFDDNNDDWNAVNGVMNVAQGYIVEGEGADYPFDPDNIAINLTQSVSFNGKINNGIKNVAVFADNDLADGFTNQNLIGNPYPSAIDIKKFYSENSTLLEDAVQLEGTFYFWTHGTQIASGGVGPDAYNFTNDDYATATTDGAIFNSVAANGDAGKTAPEFIASGQSFFVDVVDNGTTQENLGNLVFNNAMRVTGNNDQFRNPTEDIYDRVWLNMTNNNGLFRQILVGFFESATSNHDRGIDGKRMLNGDNFDFYSLMNETKYVIQGVELLNQSKTIKIGVEAPETGSLTFNIDHLEGDLENVNIYIKDNLFETLHNLKIADFNFDISTAGEFNNRFELVFSREVLATTTSELVSNTKLVIANNNANINVEMIDGSVIKNIQAYDVLGKLVLTNNPNNNMVSINTTIKNGTVLIFKVTLVNGQTVTKKFIKF